MGSLLRATFSFPHPVNEYAARTVAAMVVTLSLVAIVLNVPWLLIVLTYGFLARVLTGPKLSPMGLLATRVIVPLIGDPYKPVAGPPKRFAQSVGLAFSTASLLLFYVAGAPVAAYSVLGVLTLFAGLEAFVGFCAGCFVFNLLMRAGVIPESVCRDCNDLSFQRV